MITAAYTIPIKSIGCGCITVDSVNIKDQIKSSDIIFKGTVIKIDTVEIVDTSWVNKHLYPTKPNESMDAIVNIFPILKSNELHYTFQISKVYKGSVKNTAITVKSGQVNAHDCKYIFNLNENYIVFANHPGSWIEQPIIENDVVLNEGKYSEDLSKYETTSCTLTQPYTSKFQNKIVSNL